MSGRTKLPNQILYQTILDVMKRGTDAGTPYFKVGVIVKIIVEVIHPEHYGQYANPLKTGRDSIQGRLSEMVADERWPVKERNKDYLKARGYPDWTHLYYLTDRPAPPPPCGDGSDVA